MIGDQGGGLDPDGRASIVEVVDRQERPSLTGRLVAPWVDVLGLQTETQRRAFGGRGDVWGPLW